MKYELYMGTYYLMDGRTIVHGCDEVAIAFSKEEDGSYILHKHGSLELVKNWIDRTREAFKENGFGNIANSFYLISGKFPVEDLNRILDTSGWVKCFLEKHNISLEDKKIIGDSK